MFYKDKKVLNSICKYVLDGLPKDFGNPGLLTGNSGASLFCYEISRLTPSIEDSQAENNSRSLAKYYMQIALDQLRFGDMSLASGITGVAFVLNYLSKTDLFEPEETDEILEHLDSKIANSVSHDIEKKLYDYMYGYLGKGYYLRGREGFKQTIDQIDYALKNSIESFDMPLWRDTLGEKYSADKPLFSFGLAHGISGILHFLIKSFKETENKDSVKLIIENAIKKVLEFELSGMQSLFPDDHLVKRSSRLGWCRGDLGIANIIYNAGEALENDEWKKMGLDIFLHCSKRTLDDSLIRIIDGKIETGFCHGVAAPAHFFHSIYLRTGESQFLASHNYWKSVLLNHFNSEKIYLQFNNEESTWNRNSNLLQGDIGIALSLLEIYRQKSGVISELFMTD